MTGDPIIILVRGPLAVGKSTIATLLTGFLHPCAHIEVDTLRKMPSDGDLSERHLRLAKTNAALLARRFVAEGYSVVIDSAFVERRWLDLVESELAGVGAPVRTVTLGAKLDELERRDAGKASPNFERVAEVFRNFRADEPAIGIHVETSGRTPNQVLEKIVEALALERRMPGVQQ